MPTHLSDTPPQRATAGAARPFRLRDLINSRYVRWLILPLLGLCLWVVYENYYANFGSKFPDFRNKVYFWDEETKEVIIKTDADIPPLLGKGGKPTVVQAVYLTSTTCKEKVLVYLLKYADEAKAAIDEKESKLDRFRYSIPIDYANQLLVRRPEAGSPWVPYSSAEGTAIRDSLPRAPGAEVKFCNPSDEGK